jgi:hypothetical protein
MKEDMDVRQLQRIPWPAQELNHSWTPGGKVTEGKQMNSLDMKFLSIKCANKNSPFEENR